MSAIDSIAHAIKGTFLGALGGLLLPVVWMSIVFGGPGFVRQLNDGSSIFVILTSLIAIPFSTAWRGLFDGGLITTIEFGAAAGLVIAIVTLVFRQALTKRTAAIVCGVFALVVAVALIVMQSSQITLATGLIDLQIWVLAALFIVASAWLAYKMRDVYVA